MGPKKYPDLKYKFIRGLIANERSQRSRHYLKSAAEWTSRAIVSLDLADKPVKSVKQAAQLEGIGGEQCRKLKEIQENGEYSTERPPEGRYCSSAAAILVAMLLAKRQMQDQAESQSDKCLIAESTVLSRASRMCEEPFLTSDTSDKSESKGFCPAWWRMHVLIGRGYIKKRSVKKEAVYELLAPGEYLALQLSTDHNPDQGAAGTSTEPKGAVETRQQQEALYTNDTGEDGVVLCVDTQEWGGDRVGLGQLTRLLDQSGVRFRTRRLCTGDYLWLWRRQGQETTLPVLVERKRADDLARSIVDERLYRQLHKMCEWKQTFADQGVVATVQYLVEGQPEDYVVTCLDGCGGVLHCGYPTVDQVNEKVAELEVHPDLDGVMRSANIAESVQLLALMSEDLQFRVQQGQFNFEILVQTKPVERNKKGKRKRRAVSPEQPYGTPIADREQPFGDLVVNTEQPLGDLTANTEQPLRDLAANTEQLLGDLAANTEQPLRDLTANTEQPLGDLAADVSESVTSSTVSFPAKSGCNHVAASLDLSGEKPRVQIKSELEFSSKVSTTVTQNHREISVDISIKPETANTENHQRVTLPSNISGQTDFYNTGDTGHDITSREEPSSSLTEAMNPKSSDVSAPKFRKVLKLKAPVDGMPTKKVVESPSPRKGKVYMMNTNKMQFVSPQKGRRKQKISSVQRTVASFSERNTSPVSPMTPSPCFPSSDRSIYKVSLTPPEFYNLESSDVKSDTPEETQKHSDLAAIPEEFSEGLPDLDSQDVFQHPALFPGSPDRTDPDKSEAAVAAAVSSRADVDSKLSTGPQPKVPTEPSSASGEPQDSLTDFSYLEDHIEMVRSVLPDLDQQCIVAALKCRDLDIDLAVGDLLDKFPYGVKVTDNVVDLTDSQH